MRKEEYEYKLLLSIDFTAYLIDILLKNYPNKVEMITHLLNKWDSQKQDNLAKFNAEYAKRYAEKTGDAADVADQIKAVVVKTIVQKQ
jgi:predicted metal-dependent HD superfamily phosphohydrolase